MLLATFQKVLSTLAAKPDAQGKVAFPDGRRCALHVSKDGATLAFSQIEELHVHEGDLIEARNEKDERLFVELSDVFAVGAQGGVDSKAVARKTGFF